MTKGKSLNPADAYRKSSQLTQSFHSLVSSRKGAEEKRAEKGEFSYRIFCEENVLMREL
jgi:hypothetical protein